MKLLPLFETRVASEKLYFYRMSCDARPGQTVLMGISSSLATRSLLLLGLSVVSATYLRAQIDFSIANALRVDPMLSDAPSTVLARVKESSSFPSGNAHEVSINEPPEHPRSKTEHFDEEAQRNTQCEEHTLRGKPCRVSWVRVISSSVMMLAAQHGGNIWMDKDTRFNLTHGSFWGDYAYCVEHYRWSRWKDDDPFGVDYIGHPMMGALTSSIYEQNDPKQRALMFENTHRYWAGRLKAMAYSAAYSAQWKIGPASEASIGNSGMVYYIRARDGVYTNETGMQDFFITPIGGLAWNVGEDVIDLHLMAHVRHAHPRNKPILFAASLMTPLKAAANLTRLRPPWYRDPDLRTKTGLLRMEH